MTSGVEVEQRGPGDGIESLEQKHDRHIAVYDTRGGVVRIVCVNLGEAADDEQADDEEGPARASRWASYPTER